MKYEPFACFRCFVLSSSCAGSLVSTTSQRWFPYFDHFSILVPLTSALLSSSLYSADSFMAFDFERYLQAYELESADICNNKWCQISLSSDEEDISPVWTNDLLTSKDKRKCLPFLLQNEENFSNGDETGWLNGSEHRELERVESTFRPSQGFEKNSGGSGKIGLFKQTSLPASFNSRSTEKTKQENRRRRRQSSVRFADEIGENLTTFLMIPSRFDDAESESETQRSASPNTTTRSDNEDNTDNRTTDRENQNSTADAHRTTDNTEATLFQLCFDQPAANFDEFRRRLFHQFVCLENVRIDVRSQTDGTANGLVDHGTVLCTIKVRNIHPAKRVFARCTDNNWRSYADISAIFVGDGTCGNNEHDTFTFALRNPFRHRVPRDDDDTAVMGPCSRKTAAVEFAVCYQVHGSEYWDNNEGQNYRIVWM